MAEFDITSYMAEQRRLVDSHLESLLPPADTYPSILHEAMRYSVFAGGKRIRPLLALATSDALGGPSESTLQFGCALELIHTYSLIHDDLPAMDNDDYRRGKLSCHKKFGEGIAILAGNGLLTHAFHILSRMQTATAGRIEVLEKLCRAIGTESGVIAGQVVDLTTQGKEFTAAELQYIHSSKTGALIEVSVAGAAMLSRATASIREYLSHFGLQIGLAFQIVDDVLDVVGTAEELGKTKGKDALRQKATFPSLFGIEESKKRAESLVASAISALDELDDTARPLRELARFISLRRF
jgi:geranylgeranyl diphosphate synthase type II